MRYFKDLNDNLFANPLTIDALTEVTNPIWNGKVLPNHPNIDNVEKDGEGNFYEFYNDDGTPDITKIQEKTFARLVKEGEDITKQYAQSVVDAYNAAHNIHFESVYNCAVYKDIDTYPHQQFCKDVLAFNAEVWEKAREIQEDILAGNIAIPTKDEFIAMLPSYDGIN